MDFTVGFLLILRNGKSCNPDILQHSVIFQYCPKLRQGYFRFLGQSLIKQNCHNSRTSDDIDMNLRPIIKLDKKNKAVSKKSDDDVISTNCDVIVIFSIYCQTGAIREPNSGDIVCKTYIFINSNLLSFKN